MFKLCLTLNNLCHERKIKRVFPFVNFAHENWGICLEAGRYLVLINKEKAISGHHTLVKVSHQY